MGGIKKGILKGFLELNEKPRKIPEFASGEDKSGTTAVSALITVKYLLIANCGDSRCVACTNGNQVLVTQVSVEVVDDDNQRDFLQDHKPSNEPEKRKDTEC